jgi:hypothetical protein
VEGKESVRAVWRGSAATRPFVGPVKGSLCARRMVVGEKTAGTYGFSFG